jgi:hypothetical protein
MQALVLHPRYRDESFPVYRESIQATFPIVHTTNSLRKPHDSRLLCEPGFPAPSE